MASFTENKKKKYEGMSFEDFTKLKLGVDSFESKPMTFEEFTKQKLGITSFDNDIAPVATTTGSGIGKRRDTKKEEEKERKWFEKGAFEDGYQFGDITKTILGSATDIGEHLTSGVLKLGESTVDALAYLAPAFSASQQAQYNPYYQFDIKEYKEQQKEMSDFIKKDIVDEEKIAKTIITNPAKSIGIDAENESVFGEKSDALAESVGQLGATFGLQAVGVPWFLTTGVSAFGGEAENALKQGATYEQAGGSALISAGSEILFEKLSGGIKFGGKTLDDVFVKPLTEQITNKTLKTLANIGIDTVGEGTEEVLTSIVSNLGTALYKEENLGEILASEEALDGYIESFIGGAVLGGGMSTVKAIRESKADKTTYTANEQTLIDSVVEERVKEQEQDGKKLDKKEIAQIEKDVKNALERGEIDIDTIEKTLGGETYNAYDSLLKESEEFNTLYKTESGKLSREQENRLNELEEKNKANPYETELSNLRERLSQEVKENTKNDTFLLESYNQKAQKGKAYEADLSKYEGKQQEVVKKAMESGLLNNTRRTHEFVDFISKLASDKNKNIDFTTNQKLMETGFVLEGKTINGYVQGDNITLNLNSKKALNTIVGHEILHVVEGTELINDLHEIAKEIATIKGEYDSRMETIKDNYKNFKDVNIQNEFTADIIGDYLFTDSDFINSLSTKKPNLFKKIYDEIKYMLKIATAGSEQARALEKLKNTFAKAYKETSSNTTTDGKTKLSLSLENIDNNSEKTYNINVENGINSTNGGVLNGNKGTEQSGTGTSRMVDRRTEVNGEYGTGVQGGREDNGRNSGISKELRIIENTDRQKLNSAGVTDNEFWDSSNNPELFSFALETGKNSNPNGVMVDGHTVEELKESGTKTFLSKDNMAGGAVTPDGNITGVFKNANSHSKFAGADIILTALNNGGTKLDCYGSALLKLYSRLGFEPVAKVKFNPEYAPDGWDFDKFGMPDIYVMKHNGKTVSEVVDDYMNDTARKYTASEIENLPYMEYDEALEYRDSLISKPTDNADIHYSLSEDTETDKNYLEAVKNGDTETAQKLVDEVAKKSGYTIRSYHGTLAKDFTEFKKEFIGSRFSFDEKGFFFIDNKEMAEEYAKGDYYSEDEGRVLDVYLKVEKPLIVNSEYVLKEGLGNVFKTNDVVDVWDNYSSFFLEEAEKIRADGIIIDDNKSKMTVVFKPNQIKSADTVTYDNYGEVIPLSRRFGFRADMRYQLSGENQNDIAPTGKYNVYGKDIALEKQEEIAPVREVADDYAPLTEEEANERDAMQGDRLYSLNESDMPEEVEAPIYDELQPVEAVSPFDEKDIQEVGNRKQKAYMFENPEVKPFFQEEANIMLGELQNSVKGERLYNDQLYYDTNGEQGWFGTRRETSEQIAYMLDKFKYTYADIEKGLRAIIEDNGKENNAISKRLEFMIDERLREGYTDFSTGMDIPANDDYIALLTEKQINDYSDEAYNRYLESLAYAEAPVETTEEVAPVREDIAISEGTQRVMDFESGEVIDETIEPENKTYHKKRKELRNALIAGKKNFLADAMDNAKNLPSALMNNTDTIRVTEMVFGRENAKLINETIFQKAIDNESKSIAWQNKERKEIKDLGIKPRSKESEAVQKYGEKEYAGADGKMIPYGDAELAREFPDIATQNKIKNASRVLREKYDNYIDEANKVLTDLGFDPIKKRKDYMRHFEALTDAFSRMGIPFNVQQMKEHNLPTDINGLTDMFTPQKNFFANAMQRKGNKTTLDAITGIDGYIGGISNLIHHTEDIQRGRAFEEMIRDSYGQANAQQVLESIEDENARALRLQQIQDNHLSGYASWVHDWTNNLAGKKDMLDRAPEHKLGRPIFAVLDTIRKQVGANMIGFNVSSAMTNMVAPVQALAKTNKVAFTKGTVDTFKNIFKNDGFVDKNSFLTARMGTDNISKTPWEKVQSSGYIFMKGMDYFTSNLIVRSKYHELLSKGMSEEVAHKEAGKFASRIMGDRTKGANAQLFNSKLFNVVGQFQLEVNNQLYSMFYDTYHESKEQAQGNALKTATGMTFVLGQLFVYTHLFGQAFESVAGYNPTFDVIDIIKTALGLGDDDEDEEKPLGDRLEEAGQKLLKALPYTSIFTDGGRIPISSALPIKQFITGKDSYGNEKTRWETIKETAPYYFMPAGYGQLKKTTKGLSMFDEDLPVSGSYTDSGNLRFPVEDTLKNRVQSALFGQYSNENAREYFDNERQPLKEKQIEEFAELDIPIKEYWKYRDGLKEQETLEDKFDYIANLDLPIEKKNIMINNIVDRKEEVDLTNYNDFSGYEEFDFAVKNPAKYEYLQSINVSYADYNSSEASREAYNWAYKNQEKYLVSRAVSDVVTYRNYAKVISDIEADKDNYGKTISGSRKDKVIRFIDGLNLDYGGKLILFKSEYPSDNTYNMDIINYLDSLDNLSFEEKLGIATELGFTVEADGTIRW